MNFGDIFKSLAIDTWYKATLYLSGITLVASLFIEVKGQGVTNAQLQYLAAGVLLVSLGEWKNHKVESWFKPPNVYTGAPALMSRTIRKADFVGVIMELAGGLLVILTIYGMHFP